MWLLKQTKSKNPSKMERRFNLNNIDILFYHNRNSLLSGCKITSVLHSGHCQWMFLLCCIADAFEA